jgi:glycolate oxidase
VLGGSITGEHGVGVDKMAKMPRMFSADDLQTMQLLRCAFDPSGLANPRAAGGVGRCRPAVVG